VEDATSLLFDLPGFRVVECTALDDGHRTRRVVVMQIHDEHGCPRCGTIVAGRPYDVRESRVRDLTFGEHPLLVVWCKRRYRRTGASSRSSPNAATKSSAAADPRSGEIERSSG
jgi:transposase